MKPATPVTSAFIILATPLPLFDEALAGGPHRHVENRPSYAVAQLQPFDNSLDESFAVIYCHRYPTR